MSEPTRQARTSLVVDGREPILIEAGDCLNDVYGALADERRRRVLYELARTSGTVDVRALACNIAEMKSEPPGGADEELIRQVHISLRHRHLPKLAETELIEYDAEEGTVEGTIQRIESIQA